MVLFIYLFISLKAFFLSPCYNFPQHWGICFVSLFAFTFCAPYAGHSECAEVAAASGHAGSLTVALVVSPVDGAGLT